jgi:AraC-like DNA-binding protein
MGETLLIAVNLIGAGNGLILSLFLLVRRDAPAGLVLGILLAVASTTMALITVEHATLLPRHLWIYLMEETLTLLSGPLLLHYVMLSVRHQHPHILTYLPPVCYIAAVIVDVAAVRELIQFQFVIFVQVAYTLVSIGYYLAWLKGLGDQPKLKHRSRFVAYVLGCLVVIHLAQIVRFGFSDVASLREIVPVVVTVAFYALMVYALQHSRLLRQVVAPVVGNSSDPELETLERCMVEESPYLDPNLTLGKLAEQLKITETKLSSLVNRHRGMTFYQYLTHHRVLAAQATLKDPKEKRFTVDGIGVQSGFRSRSAFYKAFKDATGLSPAAYRDRHNR